MHWRSEFLRSCDSRTSAPGAATHNSFVCHDHLRLHLLHRVARKRSNMGLTDSKIAAQAVFEACSNAEKSGKNEIKAMLTDPKVSFDTFTTTRGRANLNEMSKSFFLYFTIFGLACLTRLGKRSIPTRKERTAADHKPTVQKKFENSRSLSKPSSY